MSTTASADKRKTGGARSGRRQRLRLDKTPYSYQFGALTVLLLLAAGAQWVVKGPLASTGYGSVIIAVAGVVLAGLFTWVAGRALYHYLASAKSAVVVLTAAMVLTGVGTVVLQGISEADFTSRYGSFAGPLLWLGLNDVFHSYPFTLLLIMLGATSTITVIRRRKTLLRWRHFGLLLTHISVVALLIGAAIGTMTGSKGMIHLETGRSGNSYVPDVRPGEAKRPPVQLGFDVRLDHFELDNYTAEYKVYTYESDGAGDYDMVASEEPEVGKTAGVPAPDADIQVTVKKVFKRARQVSAWVPASTPAERASKPGPAAKIEMFRGDTVVASGWLQDTEKVLRDPGQRFEMHLAWTAPDDAALSKLALPSAQSEFEIAQPDGSKVAVEPGKTFELADGRVVQVRKFLPDFVYDNTSGQAVSRSNEPRNPALVVDVSNPAAGRAPKPFNHFARADTVARTCSFTITPGPAPFRAASSWSAPPANASWSRPARSSNASLWPGANASPPWPTTRTSAWWSTNPSRRRCTGRPGRTWRKGLRTRPSSWRWSAAASAAHSYCPRAVASPSPSAASASWSTGRSPTRCATTRAPSPC